MSVDEGMEQHRGISRRELGRLALAGAVGGGAGSAASHRRSAEARWAAPAAALPETAAGAQLGWALERINGGAAGLTEAEIGARFGAAFLAALPAKQLVATFTGYLAPSGPMAVARFEGPTDRDTLSAILTTPGADWRVTLGVDPSDGGRIGALFFAPVGLPAPVAKPVKDWAMLTKAIKPLAPKVSFLACELVDGEPLSIAAITPDRTLGLGSTFKLYVAAELTRQIASGEVGWDEPLAIRDDLRSLPNGDFRLLAAGTTYPIRTFVEQMLSASDNTATDHLITRLGRERVEAAFAAFGNARPERNVPLLLTREWFAIKLRLRATEITTYLAADVATKRQILAERVDPAAATLTDLDEWVGSYLIEQIEWFASAADLTRVAAALRTASGEPLLAPLREALSINPGIAFDARTWAYVGYKGGYETGVKSDVWLLQRGDGRWFSLATTINDPKQEIQGIELWRYMVEAARLLGDGG